MNKSIFLYRNYRDFLRDWIASRPSNGRGLRLKISRSLQCHSAYITFVMNKRADFSLEQGMKLTAFLGLPDDERHFFLLLLQTSRAGSTELKRYFEFEIERILKNRESIDKRIAAHRALTAENQMTYYSSWHFAAIHMAVSAPHLRTREAIAKYFNLPLSKVSSALSFLVGVGLVQECKAGYKIGSTILHLGQDSPAIYKHHTNWRMQAIASFDRECNSDLHYSSATMISESAARKIRTRMLEMIDEIRSVIKEAKEEDCYSYTLDFFKVCGAPDGKS